MVSTAPTQTRIIRAARQSWGAFTHHVRGGNPITLVTGRDPDTPLAVAVNPDWFHRTAAHPDTPNITITQKRVSKVRTGLTVECERVRSTGTAIIAVDTTRKTDRIVLVPPDWYATATATLKPAA